MGPKSRNTGYQWIKVTDDAAFPGRDGAGALVYDDKMWLIGGWNPADKKTNSIHSGCNNEVWNSADGKTWSLTKPNTHVNDSFDPTTDWEARHTAGYAVYQDKMWIVGGDPLLGHYQYDVWASSDGVNWTWVNQGKPVPWGPRVLHHTVVFQGKIWIIGGQTLPQFAPADEVFYGDVWNTTDGINWEKVETADPFTPRRGMIGGAAVLKDRIWLLGGGTYETPNHPRYTYANDVWSSGDGKSWERHTEHAPWRGRVYHDVAVFDDRLWVMEGQGSHGKNMNDVWYSSDGRNWREVPETPWKERHAASVFTYGNALWMVAGNHMGRDVWNLVSASRHG
ncbi:hypothetical protein ACFLSJ_06480 [Verrucomicrobiota bacterium]